MLPPPGFRAASRKANTESLTGEQRFLTRKTDPASRARATMRRYLVEFSHSNYILHQEDCFTYKVCRDSYCWDRSDDIGDYEDSTRAMKEAGTLYRDLCPCYCCSIEEEQERSQFQPQRCSVAA